MSFRTQFTDLLGPGPDYRINHSAHAWPIGESERILPSREALTKHLRASPPPRPAVHVGAAGFFNMALVEGALEPETMVLFDINTTQLSFWNAFSRLCKANTTLQSFQENWLRDLHAQPRGLVTLNTLPEMPILLVNADRIDRNKGFSSTAYHQLHFFTEEAAYQPIRRMFIEERVAWTRLDIMKPADCKNLSSALSRLGQTPQCIYLSNIPAYTLNPHRDSDFYLRPLPDKSPHQTLYTSLNFLADGADPLVIHNTGEIIEPVGLRVFPSDRDP